jgi:hypothetical protein
MRRAPIGALRIALLMPKVGATMSGKGEIRFAETGYLQLR